VGVANFLVFAVCGSLGFRGLSRKTDLSVMGFSVGVANFFLWGGLWALEWARRAFKWAWQWAFKWAWQPFFWTNR